MPGMSICWFYELIKKHIKLIKNDLTEHLIYKASHATCKLNDS